MIAYATGTGTKRNLAAMQARGWRHLYTPDSPRSNIKTSLELGFRHAIDNGAWGAFRRGDAWDGEGFVKLMKQHGKTADFIVVPDIVEGGLKSLDRSMAWLGACLQYGAKDVLIPVQDGMAPWDLKPILEINNRIGLFVGGSTEFKLASLPWWGRLARRYGRWLHVGRVNSVRRINLCLSSGADSFDGTSVSIYAKTINTLDPARHQATMWAGLDQWGEHE